MNIIFIDVHTFYLLHEFTLWPTRTESTQIVLTQNSPSMFIAAIWSYNTHTNQTVVDAFTKLMIITMFAESTIIPGTITDLESIRLHMKVLAVFVITLSKLLEEVADWHLAHVILMQKFTVIAFLAQVTQPVLADNGPLASNMAKWTVAPSTASPIQKEFTQGSLVLCERTMFTRIQLHNLNIILLKGLYC